MKAQTFSLTGTKQDEIDLPKVFLTPLREDLIHKAYVNLDSHHYQRQGRYPAAGMNVVAMSNDPPTGHGQARVARIRGGGPRRGQAAGVAMVRGGRQAHPPTSEKVIHKKLNKKEKRFALCSAIAATASKDIIASRGHVVEKIQSFPMVVSDDIEKVTKAKEISKILDALNLSADVQRLEKRKARSGRSAIRGRKTKVGKSVLFVTKDPKNLAKACGSIPGIDVCAASALSVLDLAPGSKPARLTVYTKSALDEISKIKSPHLELMEALQ
ncbi:MAG: 50S ribosomal protein L4 [Candidatus Nitrosotenuis sp.]|uniref:50S ribosomal protein L4 n=1 Tax=Candidatus Nitrosotenuis uzonensis TaxID=1407055 RepID=A0A812F8U0_9ARCH|nr:50S ribosomal protein L4 [Candidatus Nitrosotenuis uzonensis]MCA2003810.1 50S ribosomal protein L4 [Candidatus Nitrosotenuis sp.]CAE6499911.1 50S ribosomal protein L4 [Candidatus Nitrosotenuis uzonensis]